MYMYYMYCIFTCTCTCITCTVYLHVHVLCMTVLYMYVYMYIYTQLYYILTSPPVHMHDEMDIVGHDGHIYKGRTSKHNLPPIMKVLELYIYYNYYSHSFPIKSHNILIRG